MDFSTYTIDTPEIRKKQLTFKKLVVPLRMRSIYWKYFGFPAGDDGTILTKDKIVCVLCKCQMIYNRNTSNLRMHLNSRHKNIIQKIDPNTASDYAKSKTKTKSTKQLSRNMDGNIDFTNMGVMGLSSRKGGEAKDVVVVSEEPSETDISNIAIIFPNQEDIVEYGNSRQDEETSIETAELKDVILNFIIYDLISPNVVSGKGFHQLLMNLSSKPIHLPDEKKIVQEILPNLFVSCKKQLFNSILTTVITNISLSIEEWTCADGIRCVSIYMHYLQSNDSGLFTKLLSTVPCTGSESVEYWNTTLMALFREWSLNSNAITAVVVAFSNENLKAALRMQNMTLVPCFLSMIQQLCSKNCLEHPEVVKLLEKCRRLVKFIRENKINLPDEYNGEEQDEDDEYFDYILSLDRPEQWLTSYLMLSSLARKKQSMDEILPECDNNLIETIPSAVDWKNISDIVSLLEPLKTIVTTLFEEKNSLISLLKPLIWKMNSTRFDIAPGDSVLLRELKRQIKIELNNAYNDQNVDHLTQTATILDPRFKTFIQQDEHFNVESHLKELLCNFVAVEGLTSGDDDGRQNSKKGRTSINSLFGNICMTKPTLSVDDKIKAEVSHYQNEGNALLEECPLEWWRRLNNRCPNLTRLANKYHCVPAIVIHRSNLTVQEYLKFHQKRSSLSANVVDTLLFLHVNKNTV